MRLSQTESNSRRFSTSLNSSSVLQLSGLLFCRGGHTTPKHLTILPVLRVPCWVRLVCTKYSFQDSSWQGHSSAFGFSLTLHILAAYCLCSCWPHLLRKWTAHFCKGQAWCVQPSCLGSARRIISEDWALLPLQPVV